MPQSVEAQQSSAASAHTAACTPDILPASAGQNVRHDKPKDTYTKKPSRRFDENAKNRAAPQWSNLKALNEFFPDSPNSLNELTKVLHQTACMLRIDVGLFHHAICSMPVWRVAQLLDRIVSKAELIHDPDAYIRKVLKTETSVV